jgi:hypothetical protein
MNIKKKFLVFLNIFVYLNVNENSVIGLIKVANHLFGFQRYLKGYLGAVGRELARFGHLERVIDHLNRLLGSNLLKCVIFKDDHHWKKNFYFG